ncbi:MAG: FHA domain-containing protein [Armatimonadota bacterium]
MNRIIRYTIAGALGSFIAWAVMEKPLMPSDGESSIGYTVIFLVGLICGFTIGLFIGLAQGISGLSPRDAVKSVIMGALVGGAGGIVGLTSGNIVYNLLVESSYGTFKIFEFTLLLLGRALGWSLIGLFIGLSQGIATSSIEKMRNGAVGGFIGGGAGGVVFEILAWMNLAGLSNYAGWNIRLISFTITGAGIGFFIGLVEEVAKKAWVIRLVGKNEGKQIIIYKPETTLGRSEYTDIPVFTDPDISERHAKIITIGKRYYLEDLGSHWGTLLNGQKITKREPLKDGDVFIIGKTRFMFRDKATASKPGAAVDLNKYAVNIPNSQNICQFCGQTKNAKGECACSFSSTSQMPAYQTQPQPTEQIQTSVKTNLGGVPSRLPKIIGVSGPYINQVFEITSPDTSIGRGENNSICLSQDTKISRSHLKIVKLANGYTIIDNNSTNGTFVNGVKINQAILNSGDQIRLGDTTFIFES